MKSPNRFAIVVAAAVLAAGLGGCKAQTALPPASAATPPVVTTTDDPGATSAVPGAAGGASGPGSGDACSLVAVTDVTTAFGETMTQTSGGPAPFCSFGNADGTKQLITHVFVSRTDAALTQVLGLEGSAEHLDGLGDDAFWEFPVGMIYVRQGDRSFTLTSTLNVAQPDGWKAAMVQLATSALANL